MYITFFLERYPRGIFAAGGAFVPTQEKKKKKKKSDIENTNDSQNIINQTNNQPENNLPKCLFYL